MRSEEALIFCLLDSPSLMMSATVQPEDFTVDGYRNIYAAMTDLSKNGSFDIVGVMNHLASQNLNQSAELAESIFRNSIASPGRFQNYCDDVKRESTKRRALQIAYNLQENIKENTEGDHVSQAISELMQLGQVNRNYSHTMKDAVMGALEAIEEALEQEGLLGITTGIKELDECLGGFHDSDLVVIGARPAMGKTAFLVSLANASDVAAGIISAEQDHVQLGQRFIANKGSVHSQNMRTATLATEEWTQISATVQVLRDRQTYINDEGSITIGKLVQQAREWKFKHDIKILYVDYIQKIKTRPSATKVEQVSEVTQSLKNLAKELNIPVVALAQIKRDVDNRADKQPQIGDLSDASEIEKEADVIMTLLREEAYDPDTQRQGIADISLCKNRHGPTGHIACQFVGKYFQFKDFNNVTQLRA